MKKEPKKGESFRRGYQLGVKEEQERILKILEEEIAISHTTIRGKTSGLTSAYMSIKEK